MAQSNTSDTEVTFDLAELLGTEDNTGGGDPTPDSGTPAPADPPSEPSDLIELPDDLSKLDDFGGQTSGQSNSTEPGASDSTESPFEVVAQMYVDKGALSPDDLKEVTKDVSDLSELYDRIEAKRQDGPMNRLTPLQQQAVKAFEAGVDVQVFQDNRREREVLDKISDAILESSEDQYEIPKRRLIAQQMIKVKNYSEKDADTLARAISKEDLAQASKEARDAMKGWYDNQIQSQIDEEIQNKATEVENTKKTADEVKTKVEKADKLFGLKVTDQLRDSIMEYATKNYGTENKPMNYLQAQLEKDPVDTTVKINWILAMTKGLTDLTPLLSKSASNATKALDQIISQGSRGSATGGRATAPQSGSSNNPDNAFQGIEGALELLFDK
jgi:hypothetical protein